MMCEWDVMQYLIYCDWNGICWFCCKETFCFNRCHILNSGSVICSVKRYWRMKKPGGRQWNEELKKRDKQQRIFSGIKVKVWIIKLLVHWMKTLKSRILPPMGYSNYVVACHRNDLIPGNLCSGKTFILGFLTVQWWNICRYMCMRCEQILINLYQATGRRALFLYVYVCFIWNGKLSSCNGHLNSILPWLKQKCGI